MMTSTLSLHEDQAATGRLNWKQTPTAPPADILGNDDGGSDSRMPSDDDQFLESLKAELYCKLLKKKNNGKNKIVLPAGFLAPKSRQCRPSAVEEQHEVVAPPGDDADGNSSPYGAKDHTVLAPKSLECRPSAVEEQEEVVAPPRTDEGNGDSSSAVQSLQTVQITNSPKRRSYQNDEWKNNSTCSDNSLQPNIAEEINGHSLQKGRHCNNDPVNLESDRNGRPRDVPSTLPVVCIDELTQRLEEFEAARHADKAITNDLQKISPRVQAPDTLVPDVDSDEAHQVTNPRKRRRCVKKVSIPTTSEDGSSCDHSPSSEDSLQLNIAEIRLQKDRHCDNNPVNSESMQPAKNIQSSSEFPSFSISMKPSHVNSVNRSGRQLTLPTKFCKRHLPDKDTTIILKDENGVEYETMYLSRNTGHGSNLSAGWAVFCDEHKLAVGDVLHCQLVNPTIFEVSVVKSNQSEKVAEDEDAILEKPRRSLKKRNRRPRDVSSTPWVVCIDELTRRLEEAEAARHADKETIINDMQKKYDSNMAAMQKQYDSNMAAMQKQYDSNMEAMQKQYDSNMAAMQKKYDSIMAAMQKSSPRVQALDTLLPDVDSDEAHQVTNPRKRRRFKASTLTGDPTPSKDGSSCDHSPCSEDSLQLTIAELRLQKGRHCNSPPYPGSLEQTKHIQSSSEFPSFSISMKPSYVADIGGSLRLPAEFCKHHLPDKDTTIILKDEKGVEYKTKYLTRAGGSSSLSAGWRVFWRDHKLAVGDILRFQLVNQTKFEVFIVKSGQSDEVDGALFSKQSASGAKQKLVTSDLAEKQKMKLEAKLKKISKAKNRLNGEAKKLEKMHESVCHELKLLLRHDD